MRRLQSCPFGHGVRLSGVLVKTFGSRVGPGDLDRIAIRPRGPRPDGPCHAAVTLDQLLQMSPAELDAIYRQGTATAIPEGRSGARLSCRLEPGEHGPSHAAPG